MSSSPWTHEGGGAGVAGAGEITLVDGSTFLVGSQSGDMAPTAIHGLFLLDTRVLSRWELWVDGRPIEPLSAMNNGPFSATFAGRFGVDAAPDTPIAVIRRRHLGRGMREDVEIRNHGVAPVTLSISLAASADFAGLFEVKAGHARGGDRAGTDAGRDTAGQTVADELIRPTRLVLLPTTASAVAATIVDLAPVPDVIDRARAGDTARACWEPVLAPGGSWELCIEVGIVVDGEHLPPSHRCGEPVEHAIPVDRFRRWRSEVPTIVGTDPVLVAAARRASDDLGALRIFDPHHADRVVVAAGAPWYMTLFGRDSLLTAWMALLLDHDLARGVLASLADAQGTEVVAATEEQPGKILHEVRLDPSSTRLLGGTGTYYGTIDATPLFVMLVGELAAWSGDLERVEELLPAVDRALAWIDEYGDRDRDGFIEYERMNPSGLVNQGWKDSFDGIRHVDGTIAESPIALCEAQAYVYGAFRARARLASAFGDTETERAADERARELARRFDEAFWVPDRGWYAVGLDADKRQIASLTSNIGHCLWTGIVPEERAPAVVEALMSPRLFSGWGLRTLSALNPGYNPLSYHCGSVWPHDTAIAIAGLARYGFAAEARRLARSLLDASAHTAGRLPELFGGFAREDIEMPVRYPSSCSPQAWAAASPLLIVRALLGLDPDLPGRRVVLRPRLGAGFLDLEGIPLGDAKVSITVDGDGIDVRGLPADVELVID